MYPEDAEFMAEFHLKKWNLWEKGWRLTWMNNSGKSRVGECDYHAKEIRLSRNYCIANDEDIVRDIILHELAHAMAVGHGHDHIWKYWCNRVGAKPERCYNTKEINYVNTGRYLWCWACGYEDHSFARKPKYRIRCPDCSEILEWVVD